MEENLNTEETRLFDLIESTDYADLSQSDLQFVQLHISEEEYTLQRKIIGDASSVYPDEVNPDPLVLPFTEMEKGKTIPLYQALLAVASVITFFLLIWPKNQDHSSSATASAGKPVVKIQKEIVHDTVVQYLTKIQTIEKTVVDTVTEFITETKFIMQEPKLLEASQTLTLPDLTKETISTKGNSLKEDNSSRFIISVNSAY